MKRRVDSLKRLSSALLAVLALSGVYCFGARAYQPVVGDPLMEQWRWRTFPDLSGLDLQCMAEGADGTMWFGTANGLWSYDGITWVNHSANESVGRIVTSICSHSDGSLYAAGGWGISQWSDGQWTLVLSTSLGRIADIRNIPVNKLASGRDGELWAATAWGALRLRNSTWTLYTDAGTAERLRQDESLPPVNIELLPETVSAGFRSDPVPSWPADLSEVCVDADGRIWLGTTTGGVLCHVPAPVLRDESSSASQGTWSVYSAADGLVPGEISSMLPLEDGSLWVVHAASRQASVFDGGRWRTIDLPLYLPPLDMGDVGGRLLQTKDGVVWLSARYTLFAYRSGAWKKYELPEVRSPSTRNVVMQSADGALWFSGPNTEIHRVDYQTQRWLTLEDLNFQWESPSGAQWFLHRDGRVVLHANDRWTSHGVEDGLMDTPVALLGTRRGEVWTAGSHEGVAAMARYDGQVWTRYLHDDFSFGVDWRAVFESSDGSMWFGAFVDTDGPAKHRNGLLQFRDGDWRHHHQPGRSPRADGAEHRATLLPASTSPGHPIEKFICLGESRDGKIWAGRNILARYDGRKWERTSLTEKLGTRNIESMLTSREGNLWVGSREAGAFCFDGERWEQFQGKDSLDANSVRSLAQTTDGSIWAATDRGVSRFDGEAWMRDVLPELLNFPHEGGSLKASASGGLWINRYHLYWMRRAWSKSPAPSPRDDFRTVRHQFLGAAPSTRIAAGAKVISQPGNIAVLWTGVVPWRDPKDARLQFSHRLDGGQWSAFTSDRGHAFFTLPAGQHRLEVRARDPDFNVDPTPAVLDFVVLPPVWRQGWFVLLMILLGGLIVAQSIRVLLEQGRLRKAHDELEVRVRQRTAELEAANRELEAFSYSVSHDLRAPLRSIDGFSRLLLEDYGGKLDEEGNGHLQRVCSAAKRMGQLIEDMLNLARVTRTELRRSSVDLSHIAQQIAGELAAREPARNVVFTIAPDVVVNGDGHLLRIVLENLLGNAWKFTAKQDEATIAFGVTEQGGQPVYFVRDNGAGFDMANAGKLFGEFQRMHPASEFPGTGIGLAIVRRVILRHGGRVWAEAAVNGGATFFFTLATPASP